MQALTPKPPQFLAPAAPAAPAAAGPGAAREKAPDQQALRAAAAMTAGGASATQLTGPGGVAPNLLNIGKNSLLGA